MATRRSTPRRKLAQSDSNQTSARTTMPAGRVPRRPATVANYPSAGTIPATSSSKRYAPGGELAAFADRQSPTPGEAAALAALNVQLGAGRTRG